jgi:type I restriction enzyme S subunit
MTEWSSSVLEKYLDLITYGFTNPMPTTDGGPYMITAKDVNGGEIQYATARHTSDEAFRNLLTDKSRPRNGDVLVTKDGTLGRVAVVQREDLCINQSVALLRPNSLVRSDYLKYLLESPTYQKRMLADAGGSTIQHIYITRLAKMEVQIPSIKVQDKILSVLRPLDGKIRNIRDNNEALERLANLIFKDWFINFGPVRAKSEGRKPYLAADIWSLFPDSLSDEGFPIGWRPQPLDTIAEFLNGLALQKYPAKDGKSLPVIKIAQLRSGKAESGEVASSEIPSRYVVHDGDHLFSWSGSLIHAIWAGGTGALNQHLFKVTPLGYPQWFAYFNVDFHMPEFQSIAASKATTMGHIQRHHLSSASVIVPSKEAMAAADSLIAPLFEKMKLNRAEASTLERLRGILLPNLMSGSVSLHDASSALEEVI